METPLVALVPLLNGSSASGATGNFDLQGLSREATVYCEWSTAANAGVYVIEEAASTGYAGTWSQIGDAITFSAAGIVDVTHLRGCYRAVRARITTAIGNGTVTAYLTAN